jgi:hypothetical protein
VKQASFFIPEQRFLKTIFAVWIGFKLKAVSVCRVFPPVSMAFILFACRDTIPQSYHLVLPAVPPAWEAILGPPHWRIEWFDPNGRLRYGEGSAATLPEADLPTEWASPVLAYPFWPARGLAPGYMRPAGAIVPFDVEGDSLRLTWEAGPEAWFYHALVSALTTSNAFGNGIVTTATGRRPDRFDWPRFRNLLRSGNVPLEIRDDPWLADWDAIAEKTIQSGFDRRRIQARSRTPLTVSVPWPGPWAGSSPFAEVYLREAGETVTVEAAEETDTLVSPGGMLRYNAKGTVRIPFFPVDDQ